MAGSGSSRPTGVTVLAILVLISGGLGLLGGGLTTLIGGAATVVAGPVGLLVSLLGIVIVVLSAAQLVLGYGFWMLKHWAWQAGVLLEAISAIVSILGALATGDLSGLVFGLVVPGVVIYYLHQPHVRAAFGAPTEGFPLVGTQFDRYIPGGPGRG